MDIEADRSFCLIFYFNTEEPIINAAASSKNYYALAPDIRLVVFWLWLFT